MGSLSILFRQCSYPVILRKILTKLQVIILRSLFFSGGSKSSFVDGILSLFKMLTYAGAPLNLPRLLFNCSGELKISLRFVFPLCIRSRSFEDVLSFKPFKSTSAIYLPSNLVNGVSFEWALTHRSFPRILPDSSNSPRVILKFFSSVT